MAEKRNSYSHPIYQPLGQGTPSKGDSNKEQVFQLKDNRPESKQWNELKLITESEASKKDLAQQMVIQRFGAQDTDDAEESTEEYERPIDVVAEYETTEDYETMEEESIAHAEDLDFGFRPFLIELLSPFISEAEGSCAICTQKAYDCLSELEVARPFGIGSVLIQFELANDYGNHLAVIASWEEGTYVIDSSIGQFTGRGEVLICELMEWRNLVLDCQGEEVLRYELKFMGNGCMSDEDMLSSLALFRGGGKIGSGFKEDGGSISTEENNHSE